MILEITINKKKRKYKFPDDFDDIKIVKNENKEIDILPIYIKTLEDIYKYTNIKQIILKNEKNGIILLDNYKTWFDISNTCTLKDWIKYKKQIKEDYIFDKIMIDECVFNDILKKCKKPFSSYILKENEELIRINSNNKNPFIDINNPPIIINKITKKQRYVNDSDFIRYSLIKCY